MRALTWAETSATTSTVGYPAAWSHMYLTGAGRGSSPRAGTSSLGREVYILGTSESEGVFAGRAGGGCDDILGLGKVGRARRRIDKVEGTRRLGRDNMGTGGRQPVTSIAGPRKLLLVGRS
jgi:hypothetical protein